MEGGSAKAGAETARAAVCRMWRRVTGIDNGRQMSLDVLFFGAHPDDVEWGAGGMALLLRQQECSFGIVDLTDGEMGSRGNEAERKQEAREAAQFVGAAVRESLHMPDCGLVDSPEQRCLVASALRRYRPRVVVGPYWKDRHPDHAAAGKTIRHAALYATLRKSADENPPHKPQAFLYYLLHTVRQPSLVVDISEVFEKKLELLRVHRSQFSKTAEEFGVLPMGLGDYLFALESRDRFFGALAGVRFGEALVVDQPLKLTNLAQILPLLCQT
jgi:N-acetylglucosamine malate deacetylase 1